MPIRDHIDVVFASIQAQLAAATTEALDVYGLTCHRLCEAGQNGEGTSISGAGPIAAECSVVSFIGFGGEKIHGAVVLTASVATVKTWQAALNKTTADVSGMVGELSHLILRHLKAYMLLDGIPVMFSAPITVVIHGPPCTPADGTSSIWQGFEGSGWRVDTRLDVSFEPGFETICRRSDAFLSASPGDSFLFSNR